MKDKTLTILLLAGTVIMTFLLGVMYYQDKKLQEYRDFISSIDTTTTVDTLYYEKIVKDSVPYPKYITINKRDTVYVKSGDSIQTKVLELQAKKYSKTYIEKDDTISYSAEISGYGYEGDDFPKLDSINFSLRHFITQTNTTTTQVIKVPQKQNKVYLAPQFTVGYDPFNKQWGAIVGLGVGVRIGK